MTVPVQPPQMSGSSPGPLAGTIPAPTLPSCITTTDCAASPSLGPKVMKSEESSSTSSSSSSSSSFTFVPDTPPTITTIATTETTAINLQEEWKSFAKEWGLWLAIVCAVVCPFLDETIVATAIPSITNEFGALRDAGWYASTYFQSMSSTQLIYGRLYSTFSPTPIFLSSLFLFELGSLLCAVSRSSKMLITGRYVSGVGAAGLYSGVMALFALALPRHKLPVYVGVMGSLYAVAAVLGPVVGGLITENGKLGWRFCFWINLPVAVPPLLANLFFIKIHGEESVWGRLRHSLGKKDRTARVNEDDDSTNTGEEVPGKTDEAMKPVWARIRQLDFLGMVLLIPGVTCLVVALDSVGPADHTPVADMDSGKEERWSSSPKTIGLFVASVVLLISFVISQWWIGDERALLPGRIIRRRLVYSCAVFTTCIESCFCVMVYYLPMWFQIVQDASACQSGIRYLALVGPYCFFEVLCGLAVSRWGYVQPFMLLGSVLVSVGGGLLTTLGVNSGPVMWAMFQMLAGTGLGAATDQPGVAVQRLLDEEDAPLGFATILFCQNLGPTMAVSIANSIWTRALTSGMAARFPGLDAQKVMTSGATALREMVPAEDVPLLLEIYNDALARVFFIVVACSVASVFAIIGIGLHKLPEEKKTGESAELIEGRDVDSEKGVIKCEVGLCVSQSQPEGAEKNRWRLRVGSQKVMM